MLSKGVQPEAKVSSELRSAPVQRGRAEGRAEEAAKRGEAVADAERRGRAEAASLSAMEAATRGRVGACEARARPAGAAGARFGRWASRTRTADGERRGDVHAHVVRKRCWGMWETPSARTGMSYTRKGLACRAAIKRDEPYTLELTEENVEKVLDEVSGMGYNLLHYTPVKNADCDVKKITPG